MNVCNQPSRITVSIMLMMMIWMFAGLGCATPKFQALSPNPLALPGNDFETVWNTTVMVLDEYFDIESENRLARRIVTKPQTGATLLEPFHGDSVGARERLESTLQSIRRFAIATVSPNSTGGWSVKIEVFKELEDVIQADRQALATINLDDEFPVSPSPETLASQGVKPGARGVQWLPRGRDHRLEQVILNQVRETLFVN